MSFFSWLSSLFGGARKRAVGRPVCGPECEQRLPDLELEVGAAHGEPQRAFLPVCRRVGGDRGGVPDPAGEGDLCSRCAPPVEAEVAAHVR